MDKKIKIVFQKKLQNEDFINRFCNKLKSMKKILKKSLKYVN